MCRLARNGKYVPSVRELGDAIDSLLSNMQRGAQKVYYFNSSSKRYVHMTAIRLRHIILDYLYAPVHWEQLALGLHRAKQNDSFAFVHLPRMKNLQTYVEFDQSEALQGRKYGDATLRTPDMDEVP